MSILFSSDNGWIISHLDYVQKIYNNVQDHDSRLKMTFNENFFKINSQYLRQNQINNFSKNDEDITVKKKKKKLNTLPEEIIRQNNFVKERSEKILRQAQNNKLFDDIVADNNEKSRLESRNFYAERLESSFNFHGSNEQDMTIVAEFKGEKYVFPNNCKFYCYDIKDVDAKIDSKNQYDFVLLDPPWWNKSIRRKKTKFQESSYKMMYNEEIMKIPVDKLLNANGIVAVWCTNSSSQVKSILEEMFPAWNVVYKAKWYWLKITQSGIPICNFDESHGKQPYEQLIIGSRASTNFEVPDKKIIISIPSAIHSHKPPLIEIFKSFLSENLQCMEIFARYLLPGWTSWGFEVLKFQHLSLYSITKVS